MTPFVYELVELVVDVLIDEETVKDDDELTLEPLLSRPVEEDDGGLVLTIGLIGATATVAAVMAI